MSEKLPTNGENVQTAVVRRFPLRLHTALLLMLVWSGSAGVKIYDVMTTGPTPIAREGIVHEGSLPALRGRLLDRNGVPLSWSERSFSLVYTRPQAIDQLYRDMHQLEAPLGLAPTQMAARALHWPQQRVPIRNGLSAKEILALQNIVAANERFEIRSCFRRRQHPGVPRFHRQLGQTRQYGRREVGINGWEQLYNAKLAGVDGKYRVEVDRNGNWVPGTWRQTRKPRPGYDVYLPISVDPTVAAGQ